VGSLVPKSSDIRGRVTGKISITLRGKYPEFPKVENAIQALFSSDLKGRKEKTRMDTTAAAPIIITAASKNMGLRTIALGSEEDMFINR